MSRSRTRGAIPPLFICPHFEGFTHRDSFITVIIITIIVIIIIIIIILGDDLNKSE
jgi:hypothetical protein